METVHAPKNQNQTGRQLSANSNRYCLFGVKILLKKDMRKRAAEKRPLLPDPCFNGQLVTRFVNNLMRDGKKNRHKLNIYDAIGHH
jgi:hypothetical protein